MTLPLLLGLICLISLLLALALLFKSQRQAGVNRVFIRLGSGQPELVIEQGRWVRLERAFLRAGLALPKERLGLILGSWALLLLLGLIVQGWPLALGLLLAPPLLLRLVLGWRYQRRVQRMIQQLPQLLDQVVRSLQTGRTLGDAMVRAIELSPDPLRTSLSRVSRNVQMGVSLPDALQDVAELYERDELRTVAIGVRVNHRYGGSASDLLGNLIKLIHEREQIARQLRAMTGETRMTAVVLALLPVGMAAYILAVNPGYLLSLWAQQSGQHMLLTAFAMQVLGCFILWRMLRSV